MITAWTLPAIMTGAPGPAAELLAEYFGRQLPRGSGPFWSGALFERLGAGGDSSRVTAEDIVAVSMLGVNLPAHVSLRLLGEVGQDAHQISHLLGQIPDDANLAEPNSAAHIAPGSPAWQLWDLVRGYHGVGTTMASKLLARKRPLLIPVQDSVVTGLLGHRSGDDFGSDLRDHLGRPHQQGGTLASWLRQVRTDSGIGSDISEIRIFDIVVWMSAHQDIGRAR